MLVDAVWRRYALLSILEAKVLEVHFILELYKADPYLKEFLQGNLKDNPYTVQEGYLCKSSKLCIPRSPLSELLVREAHGWALVSNFGLKKTIDILKEHFYWPRWDESCTKLLQLALYAIMPRVSSTKVCVLHCPYLWNHGIMLVCISLWPSLGPKGEGCKHGGCGQVL